ncbi:N-terminal C2 in EEIG1 and EHBP1 proteins [Ceratobasidium sp. AG-Ba]|nr:N-terminal C2 in EEIG1 and EHBP1 proteins [Ceratobasidium sp. AG-Ba]
MAHPPHLGLRAQIRNYFGKHATSAYTFIYTNLQISHSFRAILLVDGESRVPRPWLGETARAERVSDQTDWFGHGLGILTGESPTKKTHKNGRTLSADAEHIEVQVQPPSPTLDPTVTREVAANMGIAKETKGLSPCELKLIVEQVPQHHEHLVKAKTTLGVVRLNLAEYVGKGSVTRRYLLRDSKTNATLKLTIDVKWPPLQKAQIMDAVPGSCRMTSCSLVSRPHLSTSSSASSFYNIATPDLPSRLASVDDLPRSHVHPHYPTRSRLPVLTHLARLRALNKSLKRSSTRSDNQSEPESVFVLCSRETSDQEGDGERIWDERAGLDVVDGQSAAGRGGEVAAGSKRGTESEELGGK